MKQRYLSYNVHYALDVISQIPDGKKFFTELPNNIKIKCMEEESPKLTESVFCDKEYQILFNPKFSDELEEEEYANLIILLGHHLKEVSLKDKNKKAGVSKSIKKELENFDKGFATDILGCDEGIIRLQSLGIIKENQKIDLEPLETRLLREIKQNSR